MPNAKLKKIIIKNFKSLRNCEIEIDKLNILIGQNASGKSNLVEVFKLLKKIYVEKDINPFFGWSGYNNVVWRRREELPITIGLIFEMDNYEVYFETVFTGVGGRFYFVRETLNIKNYVEIKKEGELLVFKHNIDFIEKVNKNIRDYEASYGAKKILKREGKKMLKEIKTHVPENKSLLEILEDIVFFPQWSLTNKKTKEVLSLFVTSLRDFQKTRKREEIVIMSPILLTSFEVDEEFKVQMEEPIFVVVSETITSIIRDLILLFPLCIRSIKDALFLKKEDRLKEDGSNFANLFHDIYIKEGRTPKKIHVPLSIAFPGVEIRPQVTEDGRVFIKVLEGQFELLPPNISDGFYKSLIILIAIYLKPPLLVIDEIENSLYPETLQLILDAIRNSDVQTIVTTHSPVVVDMTEPSDVILVEKTRGETSFKRVKDPEKIKKFLQEKGITLSEGWLYGELFEKE